MTYAEAFHGPFRALTDEERPRWLAGEPMTEFAFITVTTGGELVGRPRDV